MSRSVVFVFVLLILGLLPYWPYSREWGYQMSSGVGIVFFVFLVLKVFRAI